MDDSSIMNLLNSKSHVKNAFIDLLFRQSDGSRFKPLG
jgi:hypothetical protein